MSLRKNLVMLLATLALSFVLAACDSAGNANQVAPTPTTAPVVQPTKAGAVTPGVAGPTPEAAMPTLQVVASTPAAASTEIPTVAGDSLPGTSVPTAGQEQPLTPEANPPGDIPDTQAFVKYTSSAGGYELDVPEGWARSENGPDVSFVSKLDGVMVALADTVSALTAGSVRSGWAATLQRTGRAVQVGKVQDVTLPSGPAVLVEYTSNSEPNAVTGKQVRLENSAYLFFKPGTQSKGNLAVMTLWAPLGADNVDQWKRMSESFRWK